MDGEFRGRRTLTRRMFVTTRARIISASFKGFNKRGSVAGMGSSWTTSIAPCDRFSPVVE